MNDLTTLFSAEQLKTLLAIFSKLDEARGRAAHARGGAQRADRVGTRRTARAVTRRARKLEGVENNPLVSRVIDVLDADAGGDVDFKEFVESFAVFTSDDDERKLRFAFSIYDIDRDNYISNGELFQVRPRPASEAPRVRALEP